MPVAYRSPKKENLRDCLIPLIASYSEAAHDFGKYVRRISNKFPYLAIFTKKSLVIILHHIITAW